MVIACIDAEMISIYDIIITENAMKSITIRGIEAPVAERLKSEANLEGKSVNQLPLKEIRRLLRFSRYLKDTRYCGFR